LDILETAPGLDRDRTGGAAPGKPPLSLMKSWRTIAAGAWRGRRLATAPTRSFADALAAMAPSSAAVSTPWARPLADAMQVHGIDTARRAAAFLAQVLHESAGFTRLQEDLRHPPERLVHLWPRHFHLPHAPAPGREDAAPYACRPEALANRVYAGRLGNGPAESGDGWRYRGRGLLQLTGRANYTRASEALGVDLVQDPELLLLPEFAARAAAWYWSTIDGNALADAGTEEGFEQITIGIEGSLDGIGERLALWSRARAVLGDDGRTRLAMLRSAGSAVAASGGSRQPCPCAMPRGSCAAAAVGRG
jgi:putative chitinase